MFSSDDFPNGNAKCSGESRTFGLDFCTANPEKAMAKGVLRQAVKDLRRFRFANDTVGHGFYMDAYTWVVSDAIAWPYSFVNVCQVLGISSEITRTELLFGAESGWYSRSRRTAQKISTSLRDAFITASKVLSKKNRKGQTNARVQAPWLSRSLLAPSNFNALKI